MPSDVETLLKKHDAIQTGHFVLASGNHSEHYVQTAQLMQYPAVVDNLLKSELPNMEWDRTPDTILTAATGGITFAQQVGLRLEKKTIFAERSDDNELVLERGFRLSEDEAVLLVEDVVTTGGTLEELKELAEHRGADLVGVLSMINRSDLRTFHNAIFHALLDVDYPIYDPDQCPLCENGRERTRPGTKDVMSE
ncbi:MAG: phosphoribosyltransferase family protein [bacterium]